MPTPPQRRVLPTAVEEVTGALGSLADALERDEQLSAVLQQVCELAVRAVPGTDLASLTRVGPAGPETTACTGQDAFYLDLDQYRAGHGPCLEAATKNVPVHAGLPDARRRWPEFDRAADAVGVVSVLSAPLTFADDEAGSLNLYGRRPGAFDGVEPVAELYVTAVRAVLRGTHRHHQARELADNLKTALTSRSLIDHAIGIVMAARGLPADQAFALLKQESQDQNVKVRALAEQLVATVTGEPRTAAGDVVGLLGGVSGPTEPDPDRAGPDRPHRR
jgi:hypothetical protein